jgi:hypothetical protein
MKYVTTENLLRRLKGKKQITLPDLVRFIEEEFGVAVKIEEHETEVQIDWEALDRDPVMVRLAEAAREDRLAGRSYTGREGLKFLRQKIQEFEKREPKL